MSEFMGENVVDLNFIRGQFTEAELESAIITLFTMQGYTHVLGDTLHRKFEDILLEDDLRSYLSDRYPDLTPAETQKVISRLENMPSAPLYQGNRETFLLINEGFNFLRDTPGKIALHIDYINFDEPDRNIFGKLRKPPHIPPDFRWRAKLCHIIA